MVSGSVSIISSGRCRSSCTSFLSSFAVSSWASNYAMRICKIIFRLVYIFTLNYYSQIIPTHLTDVNFPTKQFWTKILQEFAEIILFIIKNLFIVFPNNGLWTKKMGKKLFAFKSLSKFRIGEKKKFVLASSKLRDFCVNKKTRQEGETAGKVARITNSLRRNKTWLRYCTRGFWNRWNATCIAVNNRLPFARFYSAKGLGAIKIGDNVHTAIIPTVNCIPSIDVLSTIDFLVTKELVNGPLVLHKRWHDTVLWSENKDSSVFS